MLNLTDCIVGFCIVLLVTTSTLYLNVIEAGSAIRSWRLETMFGRFKLTPTSFRWVTKDPPRRTVFLHCISACVRYKGDKLFSMVEVIQGTNIPGCGS